MLLFSINDGVETLINIFKKKFVINRSFKVFFFFLTNIYTYRMITASRVHGGKKFQIKMCTTQNYFPFAPYLTMAKPKQ